MNSQNPPIN